jgi:hypothetical protein
MAFSRAEKFKALPSVCLRKIILEALRDRGFGLRLLTARLISKT